MKRRGLMAKFLRLSLWMDRFPVVLCAAKPNPVPKGEEIVVRSIGANRHDALKTAESGETEHQAIVRADSGDQ